MKKKKKKNQWKYEIFIQRKRHSQKFNIFQQYQITKQSQQQPRRLKHYYMQLIWLPEPCVREPQQKNNGIDVPKKKHHNRQILIRKPRPKNVIKQPLKERTKQQSSWWKNILKIITIMEEITQITTLEIVQNPDKTMTLTAITNEEEMTIVKPGGHLWSTTLTKKIG